MEERLISICIPTYNRPVEIQRTLKSIDAKCIDDIEIVISENCAPKQLETRRAVEEFKQKTQYLVNYHENEKNIGYDRNIQMLCKLAHGKYIIFISDDDQFVPNALNEFVEFIRNHQDVGYILRSYQANSLNGSVEKFQYYAEHKFFKAGVDSYVTLFRKSVFISGFTFRREWALPTLTNEFNGTLLYQLYILAENCINHPSAYYHNIITESFEGGEFFFGASDDEKALYTPNKHTIDNEVTFIESFFKITRFIDGKYGCNSTKDVMNDMSKYSFPMLALVSENAKKELREYYGRLKKLGFDCTPYFKIYYLLLLILGPKMCRWGIRVIKKLLKGTPQL